MPIFFHCTTLDIEEVIDNKNHIILNVTSQNDAIKVGTRRYFAFVNFGGLPLKTREFCPCDIPSLQFSTL